MFIKLIENNYKILLNFRWIALIINLYIQYDNNFILYSKLFD